MTDPITVRSTSRATAISDPIVLRVTGRTRLVFIPQIVENKGDPSASIRGLLQFERKKTKDEWEKIPTKPLSALKAGDHVSLELKSGEVKRLLEGIAQRRAIFKEFGIELGETQYDVTPANVGEVVQRISSLAFDSGVIEVLQELESTDLEKLSALASLGRLAAARRFWNENHDNPDERGIWTPWFRENSWVLAQALTVPVVLLGDEIYAGGKSVDNRGGVYPDFIFKSAANTAIVEIKAPTTSLLGGKYRQPRVYGPSSDLSGGIVQALTQREKWEKSYHHLRGDSEQDWMTFNPRTVLLLGHRQQLKNQHMKASFELFRNDQRNVTVLTYDELFDRVDQLVELLSVKDLG